MSNIFYTSDLHLSHARIIELCSRPFKGPRDMDATIIHRWNEKVRSKDKVFINGDFSLRKHGYSEWYEGLLKKLNGRKILILGNHDYLKPFDYVDMGFESVHTSFLMEDKKIFIAHDPALAVCMPPGWKMICGHIHNSFKMLTDPNLILNVGVDVWDFYPVSQEEVDACFEAAQNKGK